MKQFLILTTILAFSSAILSMEEDPIEHMLSKIESIVSLGDFLDNAKYVNELTASYTEQQIREYILKDKESRIFAWLVRLQLASNSLSYSSRLLSKKEDPLKGLDLFDSKPSKSSEKKIKDDCLKDCATLRCIHKEVGRSVFTLVGESNAHIVDTNTGKCLIEFAFQNKWGVKKTFSAMQFNKQGDILVTAQEDKPSIALWDTKTGGLLYKHVFSSYDTFLVPHFNQEDKLYVLSLNSSFGGDGMISLLYEFDIQLLREKQKQLEVMPLNQLLLLLAIKQKNKKKHRLRKKFNLSSQLGHVRKSFGALPTFLKERLLERYVQQ